MKASVTRLDDCQQLLVTPINSTLTNFADPTEPFRHDRIHRYLRGDRITPRLVWDQVRDPGVPTPQGQVILDDSVLAKNYSARIELGRRQDRGKAKAVLKGIGGVTCVYGNPGRDQCWVMDSRMDDPAGDGHRKLDHVPERLTTGVYQTALPFPAVLRDTWDATKDWMLFLESVQPHYDGPLKDNRPVEDAGGQRPYPRVESRVWNEAALAPGQRIKIKGFAKDHQVPLFRVALATHRTEWIVTTDRTQHSTVATQPACRSRWKLEPLHREGQHVTGLERGQCRNARIPRNHIGGA